MTELHHSPGKSQYNQFIGIYENVFPDGYCNHMVREMDMLLATGAGSNRQQFEGCHKTVKQDEHLFLNMNDHSPNPFNGEHCRKIFWDGLQHCFDRYCNEYDILKDMPLKATSLKMQKTVPGGGYHVWHCEQGSDDGANRVAVYSLYLNTIEDAGETEYLYQKLRIPAKENTLVIWPAGYTHPHRGNAVYGDKAKYILTGWFYVDY
tara:strand:- start:2293 stop:2910 length:618 start_codon:yes stop_codon:yes gene_type:complete